MFGVCFGGEKQAFSSRCGQKSAAAEAAALVLVESVGLEDELGSDLNLTWSVEETAVVGASG